MAETVREVLCISLMAQDTPSSFIHLACDRPTFRSIKCSLLRILNMLPYLYVIRRGTLTSVGLSVQ